LRTLRKNGVEKERSAKVLKYTVEDAKGIGGGGSRRRRKNQK